MNDSRLPFPSPLEDGIPEGTRIAVLVLTREEHEFIQAVLHQQDERYNAHHTVPIEKINLLLARRLMDVHAHSYCVGDQLDLMPTSGRVREHEEIIVMEASQDCIERLPNIAVEAP